jgi:hypothetical protein
VEARHSDLLAVWQDREKTPQQTLFWEWRVGGNNQHAAMPSDLKLAFTDGGKPEPFNVENDMGERHNIVAVHPELVKRLEKELKDWLATEPESSKWARRR